MTNKIFKRTPFARVALHRLPLCFASTLLACGPTPYTKAAGAYGTTTQETSTTVSAVRSLLANSCWKAADIAYLQARLDRLQREANGVAAPPLNPGLIPFNNWRDKAEAFPGVSWSNYCGQLSLTSKAFTVGVDALSRYGQALSSLAAEGSYDGGTMTNLVTNIGSINTALGGSTIISSQTVAPIAAFVGKLASIVEQQTVESKLKTYVTSADANVQGLTDALSVYLTNVDKELEVVQRRGEATSSALELLVGTGPKEDVPPRCLATASAADEVPEAAPIADKANLPSQKAKPTEPHRGTPTNADLCGSVRYLTGKENASAVLSFYQFAVGTAADARNLRATLASYQSVLAQLKDAHHQLVAASDNDSHSEKVKTFLSLLADLASKLAAIRSAAIGAQ